MIFEHSDYRNYLKAELIKRSQSNPKYSLRAYAQQLKMSPGQLSRVLQNKKRMSHEKALEVSSLLKLKGSRREYFCHLVHLDATKNLLAREYIEAKLKDLHPKKDFYSLDIDQFRVVSEWYHYAILELT
ncbi:MAG: TIGR02147 family protein, partial [Deltaproteobacteria bacterium]|nr:TIGR02147 family protein [Deltaproteobacteria bacterium]